MAIIKISNNIYILQTLISMIMIAIDSVIDTKYLSIYFLSIKECPKFGKSNKIQQQATERRHFHYDLSIYIYLSLYLYLPLYLLPYLVK